HIEAGESLKGIPGVGYKEAGRITFNAPRQLRPIRELPPKAYELANFDAYERVCGRRWAMYTSSLACPYNCAYCTNDGVYGRKWNGLDPEQVAEETTTLVSRYGLSLLWIVDDNFLVDRERAEFWTNSFTPYPGAPIMERAFELGIEVPKSLEGWADFFPRYTILPWLKGKPHEEVQTMREFLRLAFNRVPIGSPRKSRLRRVV